MTSAQRITNQMSSHLMRPLMTIVALLLIGMCFSYTFSNKYRLTNNKMQQSIISKHSISTSSSAGAAMEKENSEDSSIVIIGATDRPITCREAFRQSDVVDWKNANISELAIDNLIGYFLWSNKTTCRLLQYFGGLLVHRPANPTSILGEEASAENVPVAGLVGHFAVCLDPLPIAPRPKQCLLYSTLLFKKKCTMCKIALDN